MRKGFDAAASERELNRRFREVREATEGPRGKLRFARKIGESHSNVSRYETGRTLPGHVLQRVCKAYGVAIEWLLLGKGRMFDGSPDQTVRELELKVAPSEKLGGSARSPRREELAEFYVLPLLRDPTAAGPGRRITEHDIEGPAIIHRAWCPHPDKTDYVRVAGNSMEPGIPDNSIVTIDKTQTSIETCVGKVVAIFIRSSEEVTLRRLQRDDVNPNRLIGVPDNMTGQNRPHVMEEGDRIIGRVVSVHALVQ